VRPDVSPAGGSYIGVVPCDGYTTGRRLTDSEIGSRSGFQRGETDGGTHPMGSDWRSDVDVGRLYRDVLHALGEHAERGGTAYGAASLDRVPHVWGMTYLTHPERAYDAPTPSYRGVDSDAYRGTVQEVGRVHLSSE
jgi:hypothetical protein